MKILIGILTKVEKILRIQVKQFQFSFPELSLVNLSVTIYKREKVESEKYLSKVMLRNNWAETNLDH